MRACVCVCVASSQIQTVISHNQPLVVSMILSQYRSLPAVSSIEEAQLEKACNLAKKLKRRSKRMELFLTMDLSRTLQ